MEGYSGLLSVLRLSLAERRAAARSSECSDTSDRVGWQGKAATWANSIKATAPDLAEGAAAINLSTTVLVVTFTLSL
jgi:hypothetical protein